MARSIAPRVSSEVVEMIDNVERGRMPGTIEFENLNRSQLDDRFPYHKLSHDRSNDAAMRDQQRIFIAAGCPNRE